VNQAYARRAHPSSPSSHSHGPPSHSRRSRRKLHARWWLKPGHGRLRRRHHARKEDGREHRPELPSPRVGSAPSSAHTARIDDPPAAAAAPAAHPRPGRGRDADSCRACPQWPHPPEMQPRSAKWLQFPATGTLLFLVDCQSPADVPSPTLDPCAHTPAPEERNNLLPAALRLFGTTCLF
jgi:hypothetical protein